MTYVHGYTERETRRLEEQSLILEELLHDGTSYPPGSRVLELGCGVGAQTQILLKRHPGIELVSIDISASSLDRARNTCEQAGYLNAEFRLVDFMKHPFDPGSFDHIFVCFFLEHLEDTHEALILMRELLKPDGTLTVIEGDHGSGFWTPDSEASQRAWNGLIVAQQELGHDPNIGRRLYPLLAETGMKVDDVSPRAVYADRSRPTLLDGVVNQIIVPMVYSSEKQVLANGIVDRFTWEQGLSDLRGVASKETGTFFYTWFKGLARKLY